MTQMVEQGTPITLNATFYDSTNALVDPDSDPQVAILDPSGAQVALDTPTRVSLGRWAYVYNVPLGAELGAWAIAWTATINTVGTDDEDGFTVVAVGALTGVGGAISFGDMTARATCSPWADSDDILASYPDTLIDPALLDEAAWLAGDILYELTGRQWRGRCHDRYRPLAQWRSYETPRWWPGAQRGAYFCSCNRGRETGCALVPEIRLPGAPVDPSSIVVSLNGASFTDFALHDKRYLVRTDGAGWPCCQDLLLPSTEDRTFEVGYAFGADPPRGGKFAATFYGYQLALSMDATDNSKCLLPKRVTSITRLNTSVTILDPMTLVKDGMIGLALVDQWVASIRFGQSRRAGTVIVPGQHRSARRIS